MALGGCGPGADTGAADDASSDTSGTSGDTGWEGRCPPGAVQVETFCIDTFEAKVEGDLGDLGNLDQGTDWPDGSTTAVATSVQGVEPDVNLSWYQAVAVCENAGKHLCTVAEWQAACGANLYPWGDAPPVDEVCAVPHEDGTTDWEWLVPTGSLPDCRSPAGVYDQLGNAWEWADPETTGDDGRPIAAKLGGAWYAGHGNALCPAAPVTEHPPDFEGTIAARCCRPAR